MYVSIIWQGTIDVLTICDIDHRVNRILSALALSVEVDLYLYGVGNLSLTRRRRNHTGDSDVGEPGHVHHRHTPLLCFLKLDATF